ncbi:hypothetical protein D3C75_962550 [compost metagenome]
MLLYKEVMVPRFSFSMLSVINASMQGKATPIPIPLRLRNPTMKKILLLKPVMTMAAVSSTMPPKPSHFISALFWPMILPLP